MEELERVNKAAAYATKANMQNGISLEDTSQSVKNYVSRLSVKECMVMFTQLAVQDFDYELTVYVINLF